MNYRANSKLVQACLCCFLAASASAAGAEDGRPTRPAPHTEAPVGQTVDKATEKSDQKLSCAQLLALVRESKSIKSRDDARLLGTGPQVTILTSPYKGATKRDLQIEAIFFGKALIEGAPGQIERVKVIYAGSTSAFSTGAGTDGLVTTVDQKTIALYGGGEISPEKLLASVRLVPVQPDDAPNVVPGMQQERRLLVWQRIERLSKQGTGIKPFQLLFGSIEDAAKAGDRSALTSRLDDLEIKLSEQEEQVALAKKAAQGKGVSGAILRSAAIQAKLPMMKTRTKAGEQSEPISTDNLKVASKPDNNNFGLKRMYSNRQVLLRVLERNRNPNIGRVKELFTIVEENFKSGRAEEAFAKLTEIKSMVDRSDSKDSFSRPFSFREQNFARFKRDRISI